MALDIQTTMFIEQMAASADPDAPPLHEMSPEEARGFGAALADLAGPAPPMAEVAEHTIDQPDGSFRLRVLRPGPNPDGVIVYYHGGGWVIGSIDDTDTMARKLAERTSCTVVNVDYRLAPEHQYPTPVHDCYAALEWAHEHLAELASAGAPIFVAGDSAGGNLSAAVSLRARDQDGPPIALQILIYPVTDADFERDSYIDPANALLLTREAMLWFWDHYVPDVAQRAEPEASPLRADDLSNLPPAVVLTAEHDVLRDEGEAYAERLEAAGNAVNFQRHLGQMHGFFTMLMLPGSERGFQHVVKAVRAEIMRRRGRA